MCGAVAASDTATVCDPVSTCSLPAFNSVSALDEIIVSPSMVEIVTVLRSCDSTSVVVVGRAVD